LRALLGAWYDPRSMPPNVEVSPTAVSSPTPASSTVPENSTATTPALQEARSRITVLEREVKALGDDPAAGLLFHEMGLLWEDPLKNPRNAAVAFQHAYRLNPKCLPNLRAARRLFTDVGNWQMVVQLLEAETAAEPREDEKAALLFDKACILERRLGREKDAAALFEQVLAEAPDSLALLVQLESVFEAHDNFESLVRLYRMISGRLEDPKLKAHYLTQAGLLLEDRLANRAEASTCFREAFALHKEDPLLISALLRSAERDDKPEDLLAALSAEAEQLGAEGAVSFLAISRVQDRLGRPEDALQALQSARALKPNEPLVLAELATIYQSQGRNEELADVLLAWVSNIQDDVELVSLNLRLAALYEELGRNADAIPRYEAILARDPKNAGALTGLGKLHHRTQNWDGLLAVYDREIAAADDSRQKTNRVFRSAELLEQRVGRMDEAIARYRQCLQMLPSYLPAQKALTRLLEKLGRHAELIAVYEQELEQTHDREQTIALLHRMASVYEEKLNDLDGAIDCLQRVLKLVPQHLPTLQSLEQLFELAGRWRDLLSALELEATLAPDTKQVLALHHRAAEVLEGPLQDIDGAIRAYERVLSLSPSYLPALKALGTLYAQRGAWRELIQMYRTESESATTEHAALLMFKTGELYENKLANEDQAVAAYQEVLTLAPDFFPALRALARIYRRQNAWESLVDVLRAEAANRTDPTERGNALFQAACIWEDRLRRPDAAISVLQEVLRLSPTHAAALRALERLMELSQDVKERVALLDREAHGASEARQRHAALLKLARLYLDTLQEPARAAQCCETVLEEDPSNLWALKTLERVRAKDPARAAEVKARIADRTLEPALRSALRVAAALDTHFASAGSTDILREAFAEDPTTGRVAFALEGAIRPTGDARALAALYEIRASNAVQPDDKLQMMMRVADLSEWRLKDLERAQQWYERVLEARPDHLPALQGIRRVAFARSDWTAAKRALEAEVLVARDPATRLESHLTLGEISLQLNDDDSAVHHYREALGIDPMHPAATQGLEAILVRRGGAADLARLHEQRAGSRAAKRDVAAAATEWFAAAKHWRQAKDEDAAIHALDRALGLQPVHPESLELRAELSDLHGRYAEAASALNLRVQQGGDPLTLARLHLKLGALHQDHLSDQTRANAHLQTALARDPHNVETLERLSMLHVANQNWSAASDILQRLVDEPQDAPVLAAHHLTLGRVYEEGLVDPDNAMLAYQRAFALAPGEDEALERLTRLLEQSGRKEELVRVYELAVTAAPTPHAGIQRRVQLGELYTKLNRVQEAARVLKEAVDRAPHELVLRIALAQAYGQDASSLGLAVEEHRKILQTQPSRMESVHQLHRLWKELDDPAKAFGAAGALVGLREATLEETVFHTENKSRHALEPKRPLTRPQIESLLHPWVPVPVSEVLSIVTPSLIKMFPGALDQARVDRKADRLKQDHAQVKLLRQVAGLFGMSELEAYQSRRNAVTAELEETPAFVIGQEIAKRYPTRELRFLYGRAAFHHVTGGVLARMLTAGELEDLVGSCVRVVMPEFDGFGHKSPTHVRQIRKLLSRKALKALEGAAPRVAQANLFVAPPTNEKIKIEGARLIASGPDMESHWERVLQGFELSANRAGAIVCNDFGAALLVLFKDNPATAGLLASNESVLGAHLGRPDLQDLLNYLLSDAFFDLRRSLQ
jgi:tetratricopeptide (TPR) repeat protein